MATNRAWGDEDDDDELPAKTESKLDDNGIKTIVEYGFNTLGQKVKYTKQIKVVTRVERIPKRRIERLARLRGHRFGDATDKTDDSNVTITDYNEVKIENPKNSDKQEEVPVGVSSALEGFGKKLMWRRLQRQYGLDDESGVPPPPEGDDDAPGGGRGQDARNAPSGGLSGLAAMDAAGDMGAGGSGRYMPPSARGGAAGGAGGASLEDRFSEDRDHATLRVTNISEDTTEADLQDLFFPFGRLARIYLAKDRDTMQSRGFAFVSYVRREDADLAMQKLQGHGYDHLILKIEWAKPSAPRPDAGGGGGGLETSFRSGYGKALAQDTTEKVTFASNLTKGFGAK